MKVIGITGGVGSGKTALLEYIRIHYNCEIILADEAAHHVEEPGQECYAELVELLTPAILNEDGTINKKRMAEEIFADDSLLETVNGIIHPAVRQQIDFLFIEAALLIECGYLDIVDDMWYIYAAEEIRRKRLKEARNYSDEKIDAIMQSQLSEEEYRKACHFVIDNSGELKDSFEQIDRKVREYL